MPLHSLLIANRGEVAVRVARTAAEMGVRTVAVYAEDDARSLHVRAADDARPLPGRGPAAYLDVDRLVRVAQEAGCDAVHPGYGFLSERADFARACREAGLVFVGPDADVLEVFGDKGSARDLARSLGVPLLPGTPAPTTDDQALQFLRSVAPGGAVMVKAAHGGGGRGMRAVEREADLPGALERARSEARAAFGHGDVYVERLVRRARHVEVQVAGDGSGQVAHLWERECSLQRRHQKLVEVAPAPGLPEALRDRLIADALRMAASVNYRGLGTFEFLLGEDGEYWFLEVNPRLQVEHTVTEAITGLDLVRLQLELADGRSLAQVGLDPSRPPARVGFAVQARVNVTGGGTLSAFEVPSGPGVRVDTFAYAGLHVGTNYDPLLAKVIAHVPNGTYADAARRAYRALCALRVEGAGTNISLLQRLLTDPDVLAGNVHTNLVEELTGLPGRAEEHPRLYFGAAGEGAPAEIPARAFSVPPGALPVTAPNAGTVLTVDVQEGDTVRAGQQLAVLEAMKMEFVVEAPTAGTVLAVHVKPGETVGGDHPLVFLDVQGETEAHEARQDTLDLDHVRPDLRAVLDRQAALHDGARPDAVQRRRKTGQRTARENIADLLDEGSFAEYGGLALAAQRRRRTPEELARLSPADGLVAGTGTVNAGAFGPDRARALVMAYDYTVFAGTQGVMNHKKTDRLLQLAAQARLPLVLFAEGGGGRPGDSDWMGVAGLDNTTFLNFARLSGQVPLIGVVSGRCFAGNAALLGCCDVIIATQGATIGMGGPAMIEGGGLGVYAPEQVGPVSMQAPNGVVDVVVPDERAAARTARQYLSYFQGALSDWTCEDQRVLRHLIPERRTRAYDARRVIEALADTGSVLELRREFGRGMITALARIEGRPVGVIANDPAHLGGAIDADGADKAARFMGLCGAHGLPIVSLCDTPGFMVGPDAERTATVRHTSRMFVTAAALRVPTVTVVLRKGYGLGAQAMAFGSFHAPALTVAWPTGEFGAMGIEGAVRLGYRRELEAITDPAERDARFRAMVDAAYRHGEALNMAAHLEIDDVIDPVDTRARVSAALLAAGGAQASGRYVDPW